MTGSLRLRDHPGDIVRLVLKSVDARGNTESKSLIRNALLLAANRLYNVALRGGTVLPGGTSISGTKTKANH